MSAIEKIKTHFAGKTIIVEDERLGDAEMGPADQIADMLDSMQKNTLYRLNHWTNWQKDCVRDDAGNIVCRVLNREPRKFTPSISVERVSDNEFVAWLHNSTDNNTTQYAATAAEAVALVMAHIDEDTIA